MWRRWWRRQEGLLRLEQARSSLSCDQERQLLLEEWIHTNAGRYNPPHLVWVCELPESRTVAEISDSLLAVVTAHAWLRTHFTSSSHIDLDSREAILDSVQHSGISVTGLYSLHASYSGSIPLSVRALSVPASSPFDPSVFEAVCNAALARFDRGTAPLARAVLLTGGDARRLLVLALHTLIADWRSLLSLGTRLGGG